ncbi:MAG: 7-cyano-7-deazaguanine synthase QueC, partial [Euryarchaeota archaeon RBG_13_31_8]
VYGQRHYKEIESAKKIAKILDVKKHLILNIDIGQFGGSSLVDESIKPEIDHKLENIGNDIPNTYVPARNTIFLSVALGFAETVDADAIFIGATAVDYSGYPDCRPEYFNAFQKMSDLATKKGVNGKIIRIITPILKLNKSEIINKGITLGVPFNKTWSCYLGKKKACGRCDSCLLRLKGFKKAGLKDPLKYEILPDWY